MAHPESSMRGHTSRPLLPFLCYLLHPGAASCSPHLTQENSLPATPGTCLLQPRRARPAQYGSGVTCTPVSNVALKVPSRRGQALPEKERKCFYNLQSTFLTVMSLSFALFFILQLRSPLQSFHREGRALAQGHIVIEGPGIDCQPALWL